MADEKISLLPAAGTLSGTEPVPVVKGGVTSQTTTQAIANLVSGGNASITPITVAALTSLQGAGTISTTTLYRITDATPFVLLANFKANNQDVTTAIIEDDVYSGTVLYTASSGVSAGGRISDASGNIWNGTMPSATTLGAGSIRNTFGAGCNSIVVGASAVNNIFEVRNTVITLGDGCIQNTFKAASNTFTLGDNFNNTTIEAGVTGDDYTASPDYDFLYNNSYPSTIFTDGTDNYHRYYDPANDRIVVHNLSTPLAPPTYIGGGGGGVASVSSGTNINVDNTDPANPIINSLSDRYKTTSASSNTIGNGAKTFTVDADLAYIAMQEVLIVNSPSNHMHATVTSYSGTTLIVDVKNHTGSGTYTSWSINLDGTPVDAITGTGVANEIAYFTAGQVLASLATSTYPSLIELSYVKGVTSSIQTQLNALANTWTWQTIGTVISIVGDAAIFHFGTMVSVPSSLAARRAFKFTKAGTVTDASFVLEQVTNGSGETVTIYLRNETTATDNAIGTFTSNFGASTTLKTLFSGLSIVVNTTDDWVIKIACPTWATNPSNWTPALTLQLQ